MIWPRFVRTVGGKLWDLRPEMVVFRRGLRDRQRVSNIVHERCGGKVARGPFQGMLCGSFLPDSSAKVLGSYEQELHSTVEQLGGRAFDNVVNIGTSDGYYAVGLARRLSPARVDAFDISELMQDLTRRTAALNGIEDLVTVHGECQPRDLAAICASGLTLVFSDCEGCEFSLFDVDQAPALAEATMVIEIHDEVGDVDGLLSRFAHTHATEIISSRPRDPDAYPELDGLTDHDRELAVFERPDIQRWAVLRPRSG
jgi:hypothetical protein